MQPDLLTGQLSAPVTTPLKYPEARSGTVRLIRTPSRRSSSVLALTPQTKSSEIAEAYFTAISEARDFVYIENQYFRPKSIADALASRMDERPNLQVIILLPMAPEDVAFEGNHGADARYGEYLQIDALDRLRIIVGDRLGVFSQVRKKPASVDEGGRARLWKRYHLLAL